MVALSRARKEPEAIAKLRSISRQESSPPTLTQMKLLRDSILRNRSLGRTARLMGCDEEETLSILIDFGGWLRQTTRAELPLLVEAPAKTTASKRNTIRRGSGSSDSKANGATAGKLTAVAPPGFLSAGGKSVHKPLAAVIEARPNDQQIERWMARTYTASLPLVTFPVVAAVWRFATLGSISKLTEVSPNASFAKVAVDAWDILESARTAGQEAVSQLAGPACRLATHPMDDSQVQAFASRVKYHARAAGWLSMKDLNRIVEAADAASTDPRRLSKLASELRYFSHQVKAQPSVYRRNDVSEISEGQMLSICRAAGLPTDPPDTSRVTELRARIKQLGLAEEADQITPNAVVADQAGKLEEFMDAVKARADGREEWVGMLRSIGQNA